MSEKFFDKGTEGVDAVGDRQSLRPLVLGNPGPDVLGLLGVPGDHLDYIRDGPVSVVYELLLVDVGFQGVAAFSHLSGLQDVYEDFPQLSLRQSLLLSRVEQSL